MIPHINTVIDSQENKSLSSIRVSVVVPSYNHAPFVERCLRSIMKQTCSPSELIVIDDGSSDGSPKIIEQILKECSFPCELIARQNRGLCATLNEGLDRSRGNYFAYLGSDDIWLPGFLEARVELLESRPVAVLGYGHAYSIDERDRIIDCTLDYVPYIDGNVQQMLLQVIGPLSPTILYRRSVLERHRWNEKAKLEDYDLYLRLSTEGDFAFDPRVLSAWRRHGNNTSWNFAFMMNEWLDAQRRLASRLGLSAEELKSIQKALKWRCAEDFVRHGQKSKAIELVYRNFRGAPSLSSVARMLIRLLEPRSIMQWRKNLSQRKAIEHYGTIRI